MLIDNNYSTSQSPIHVQHWVSLWSSFSIMYLWKMLDLIKKKSFANNTCNESWSIRNRTEKAAPNSSEEKLILEYWVCPSALKQTTCKNWLRYKKAPWTICDWRKLGTTSKSSMHLAYQKEDMNCYFSSWDQEPALPREKGISKTHKLTRRDTTKIHSWKWKPGKS